VSFLRRLYVRKELSAYARGLMHSHGSEAGVLVLWTVSTEKTVESHQKRGNETGKTVEESETTKRSSEARLPGLAPGPQRQEGY
jgi:hypothetical protein